MASPRDTTLQQTILENLTPHERFRCENQESERDEGKDALFRDCTGTIDAFAVIRQDR
ncbi:hypothetical protein Pla52o_56270 [Novipirellula galeiformis]|uniref:Uncharacterized protein n=1 Tax=Novipirellula galeiformis TaxID=2528004 RepID=A0A5C6BJ45_9BACT|nr:hypothetical protein Pla52o_56270 [Novipirellula galeiformis]